jgi:hypothetical protein
MPAMRAMPRMGPATAPAIQAFDLDFGFGLASADSNGVGVEVMIEPGDGFAEAALRISQCA